MTQTERDTELVKALVDFTGFRPSRIAKEIGVAATTITRPYNGQAGTVLSRATMERLQDRWPDFPGWANLTPPSNAVIQPFEGASMARMKHDLPILGTGLGADRIVEDNVAVEQTFLYTDDLIGHAKRPVILEGRASAYGIYIQGGSMEPVHPDGGLVLIDGSRPPQVGDDAVVYLRRNGEDQEADDGESARTVLVKRLVRRNASTVVLRQFNPPIEFSISAKEVLKMHRVLTMADLLS